MLRKDLDGIWRDTVSVRDFWEGGLFDGLTLVDWLDEILPTEDNEDTATMAGERR